MNSMAYTRRALLSLLFAAAPVLADHSQAKRAAKQARKRAKENRNLASRDVADRKAVAKAHSDDRRRLNASNAELDKARRQDLADLTVRRQAHVTRPVVDTPVAEEPKPGIKPATRNVDPAPKN